MSPLQTFMRVMALETQGAALASPRRVRDLGYDMLPFQGTAAPAF